jgi:putative ABC transport system permease protein
VQAAGLIDMLPIDSFGDNRYIHIAGQPPNSPNQVMLAESRFVSTGYFDVMGIPLRQGRQLLAESGWSGQQRPDSAGE